MADNATTDSGVVAADDIGGVFHQRVKVQHGVDGSAADVSSGSPMPVADAAVLAKLTADPATQTTLAAVLAKIIAAPATEATLASILTELGQKLEPGGQVALDSATLAALETISVANFPATQPVSAASLPLPSGAATAANQSTMNGYLDGVEGLLTSLASAVAAATTDSISAALDSSRLMTGLTARTPLFAAIDAATSGDNTVVAAAGSGLKIRVLSLYLVAAGTTTVRFESGASGTALSGQMNLVANTGFVLPFNPVGWFETAANVLLNLELSAAISVDGSLTYITTT